MTAGVMIITHCRLQKYYRLIRSENIKIKPVNLDEKGATYKYWYKKQVEIYQWLFSKNNFDVSNTAYFVFASALYKNVEAFNKKLDFKIDNISHDGDHSWMDNTIIKIKETLESNDIPEGNKNCIHCKYRGVN